jgi:hypothetical protein
MTWPLYTAQPQNNEKEIKIKQRVIKYQATYATA